MRLLLSSLVIVLAWAALGVEARAQRHQPMCPLLSIKCPTHWESGQPVPVSAHVGGVYPDVKVKYNWKVSAGEIIAGQGTPAITVSTAGLAGVAFTATVEVDGIPPECDRAESCTFMTAEAPPRPRLFDRYENLGRARENERLSYFGAELRQEPAAQAYIFYFGPGDTDKRLRRAREFVINKYNIDPPRITAVNAGHSRKFKVELWVRPWGAGEPRPSRD